MSSPLSCTESEEKMEYKKKLIEVSLPLEAINDGCLQEKNPFLKGHPRSTHLWWARRPLAAARGILFAQLVDDPSSHPEFFPTEETQNNERQRLFRIIEDISKWENINTELVLEKARSEIRKSWAYTCQEHFEDENSNWLYDPNRLPEFHDPFAGGGGIPLEAQRLGLIPTASDLNPVAVTINKAMIEIPPKFCGWKPVNPESKRLLQDAWEGATGLQEDVRYYGRWIKKKAISKIGHMYPTVLDYSGKEHPVIAWIWVRTMKCPNPACGCTIPLSSTYILSTKKGKEAWAEPVVSGKEISFIIHSGKCPKDKETNKLGRSAIFRCISCGEATTDEYVKNVATSTGLGTQLMAIVADSKNGRLYLPANDEHITAANVSMPADAPDGEMPTNPRWFSPPAFGMSRFSHLFTNRQLTAMCTFSELVSTIQAEIIKDGGDIDYANSIAVYLACGVSQLSRYSCTICGWNKTNENVAQAFGRQAIPMVWDFAESNPLMGSLDITATIEWPASVIKALGDSGAAYQMDAQTQTLTKGKIVSTDPPYYDNIGYADLSDFFYVWLRASLKTVYPEMFSTMLVPKTEELVATPYRHGGKKAAEDFFLDGMSHAMKNIAEQAHTDYPITIYYAFKQSDETDENGVSSTGWETFLEAILNAGLQLTGTWPIRTERTKGLKGSVNALASSIVLVCRRRDANAPKTTRRSLVATLRKELRPALKKLQDSNIAPVDLAQSAIGPGMAVFSRYARVLEADGSTMTVKSALQMINEELDLYFNEQVGGLDSASRFCVDLYTQYAFNDIEFGDADILARAKGTSVASMASHGILYAKQRVVHLVERENLSERIDTSESNIWMLTQQLTQAMATGGVEACAKAIYSMFGSNAEYAKDLAYRLYTIAERKGWANEAYAYNSLVVAWPDIQTRAAELKQIKPEQLMLFDIQQ